VRDVREIARSVHTDWLRIKRAHGITSHKSHHGHELMRPWSRLSKKARDYNVRAVELTLSLAGRVRKVKGKKG
jgi:hypothetical protein